jgi:hypothetical protein
MRQEANDKLLQERMDKLDTLSAGIVYGKEDAWSKLQQRMEQKPAKKIALHYRLAAALLLLFAVAAGLYYYPAHHVIVNGTPQKKIMISPHSEKVLPPPAVVRIQTGSISRKYKGTFEKRIAILQDKAAAVIQETPAEVTQMRSEADSEKATENLSVSVMPAQPRMRVMHINDLDRNEEAPTLALTANNTPADMANLAVVHINDMTDTRQGIRAFLKKESFAVNVHFLNPFVDHSNSIGVHTPGYIPNNPLKFRIN